MKRDAIIMGMKLETACKALHDAKHEGRKQDLREALTLARHKLTEVKRAGYEALKVPQWKRETGPLKGIDPRAIIDATKADIAMIDRALASTGSARRVTLGDVCPQLRSAHA